MSSSDDLFITPLGEITPFEFDREVARVFPDMIQRSVPGYSTIIQMTGELAARYSQDHTHCYDLGCSLGASLQAMAKNISHPNCKLIGVDNSAAMLERCRQLLKTLNYQQPFSLIENNIQDVDFEPASVVVLNFTLQFIPIAERSQLLKKIYRALAPGGILILSEKICFADATLNDLMIKLHHNFKLANGYSELEIAQKRTALETVLVPETIASHHQRCRQAGFNSSEVWFQCFNFASFLAIK